MSSPGGTNRPRPGPPIDPATIPSPPVGSRLLGHQPAYAADPLGTFSSWTLAHGEAVRLRFGPIRVLLLTGPQAAEDVLLHEAAAFHKAPVIRRASRAVIGHSVFAAEDDDWSRQRTVLDGFFSPDRMAVHVPVIADEVAAAARGWSARVTIETLRETMALSQRIGAKVLFGAAATDADVTRVEAALAVTAADFQARVNSVAHLLLPDWVPTPGAIRRRRAVSILDDITYRLIAERRRRPSGGPDLLGELLSEQRELPWLDDRLLRDNIVTLLVDSRENPALLLTWALYLLARHPDVADRLAAEVDDSLGGRPPEAADLPRLRLVAGVLRETLRLYPPVYATGRQAIRDCTVAGISVRRGTVVLVSPAVTHRDPRWFPDPDAFRPDRWLDSAIAGRPSGGYLPFGIGPRRCLGEHLAWTIGLVGLAMLVRDHRLEAVDPTPVEPRVLLSLQPAREVMLRVKPRPSRARGGTPAETHRLDG
ncbi:MAG TPA: cytochrome P450 [Candidatus Sulfomarinibacteraceae bacterium]|nr:cytochrome P450 [Candidatus Sulfomarinibacteraceae bacterium]